MNSIDKILKLTSNEYLLLHWAHGMHGFTDAFSVRNVLLISYLLKLNFNQCNISTGSIDRDFVQYFERHITY